MPIDLQDIFSSPWVRYLALPILGAALTVFAKREARHTNLTKEDWAIGLRLMVISIFVYFTQITDLALRAEESIEALEEARANAVSFEVISVQEESVGILVQNLYRSVVILLLLVIGLWGTTSFVRSFGWIPTSPPPPTQLRVGRGLIIPNVMGVLYLYAALVGVGS